MSNHLVLLAQSIAFDNDSRTAYRRSVLAMEIAKIPEAGWRMNIARLCASILERTRDFSAARFIHAATGVRISGHRQFNGHHRN